MRAIEEIGLTRELFNDLYDRNNGFVSYKKPSKEDIIQPFGEFIVEAAKEFVEENYDIFNV